MLISFNKFCHSLINISVIQLTSTVLVQCCLVKQKHLQMYNCTSSNINHKKRQHFLILNQVSTTMEFKSRCSTNWTTCLMYMIPSKLFYPFSNTRLFLNYPWFLFFFCWVSNCNKKGNVSSRLGLKLMWFPVSCADVLPPELLGWHTRFLLHTS